MSLILLCGPPCSGKSKAGDAMVYILSLFRELSLDPGICLPEPPSSLQVSPDDLRPVLLKHLPAVSARLAELVTTHLVSEHSLSPCLSQCYATTAAESSATSSLRSKLDRLLLPNSLVIIDAQNSIKGYRYECYCAARGVMQKEDDKVNFALVYCNVPGSCGGESAKNKEYMAMRAEYNNIQASTDPHFFNFPALLPPHSEELRGTLPPSLHSADFPSETWANSGDLITQLRYKFETPDPYKDRWDRPLYYAFSEASREFAMGGASAAAPKGGGSAFDQSGMNDRSKTQTNECAPPTVLKVSSFVKKTKKKKKDQGLAAGAPATRSGEYLSSLTISDNAAGPPPPPTVAEEAGGEGEGFERSRNLLRARTRLTTFWNDVEGCVPRVGANDVEWTGGGGGREREYMLNLVKVLVSILGGEGVRSNMSTKVVQTASANFLHDADKKVTLLIKVMCAERGGGERDWAVLKDSFLKWIRYAGSGEDVGVLFREFVEAQGLQAKDYERERDGEEGDDEGRVT